jgi:hypothetical protein
LWYLAAVDVPDLARIRYVSRHFESLQGLRWLAAILAALPMVWLFPLIDSDPLSPVTYLQRLGVWAVLLFLLGWAGHRVGAYYADRFGTLLDDNREERMLPWALLFGAAIVADSVQVGVGVEGPSAVLLATAALGLWRAARGWPWRAHQLILAAVMVGALVALPLPGPQGDHKQYVQQAMTLWLVTVGVCALLDHRLLVRTLRPSPNTAGDDERLTPEEWA